MADVSQDLNVELLRRVAALERRLEAIVRVGYVVAVEAEPYRVQVNVGSAARPILTGLVPVLVQRAGASVMHSPLSVGEAVLLVSPGGSEGVSFAVPALPTSRVAPAADQAAPGTTYLTGNLELTGDVVITGTLHAAGDVVAGTGAVVRLKTHAHNPPLGGPPQAM